MIEPEEGAVGMQIHSLLVRSTGDNLGLAIGVGRGAILVGVSP